MEEDEDADERGDEQREDALHRDVALRALGGVGPLLAAAQLRDGQTDGLADDARLADDADDARHGDAADADGLADVGVEVLGREELLRVIQQPLVRHAQQRGQRGGVERLGERADERYDEEPYEARAGRDDECILESDDVAQTQHGGRGVQSEDHLELVGERLAPGADARRDGVGPESEGADHEVVETADQTRHGEQLGLVAPLLARDEHLGGCRGLGEGVFAVHLLDEVLAEGNHEQDAQHAAEERREENLPEGGVEPQDVERREGEDGSGDNDARRGADGLDDDVLAQHVLLAQHGAHAHGDDGNRDGGLEDLAHAQPQIGSGGREDDGHGDAHEHRVGGDFNRGGRGRHDGSVLLAGFEFAVGVLGKRCFGCFLVHVKVCFETLVRWGVRRGVVRLLASRS